MSEAAPLVWVTLVLFAAIERGARLTTVDIIAPISLFTNIFFTQFRLAGVPAFRPIAGTFDKGLAADPEVIYLEIDPPQGSGGSSGSEGMPIRARVGRHTRSGGGHCQNWADDQKVIIDLLNKIPRTSGGTQGGLNPHIVAGICSNELYAAISAFEDKYWPGQRSGYIDPGGAMYQKLATLAAPAAAPPPAPAAAPPPPAPPPTTGPIPRPLTAGEKTLLRSVFADTLSYDDQYVGRNDGEVGGPWNSYTPGYLPNMAVRLWSWDYSGVSPDKAAVFVHEMVHVWQSGHGSHNALRGVYLWLKYDHVWRDYDDSYVYDLDSSISLSDFNMEQQAQIIQDYYRVLKGLDVESRSSDWRQKYNSGSRKSLSDYQPYVSQLQSAGPFEGVGAGADGTAARERIMRRAWGRNAP